MIEVEIAEQAEKIIDALTDLDVFLDDLSSKESASLLEAYKTINGILKVQKARLNKLGLKIVED